MVRLNAPRCRGLSGSDTSRLGLPLNQPIVVMKHAMTTDDARQLLAQLAQEKAETISQPLQEIAALDSSFCVATPSIRDAVPTPVHCTLPSNDLTVLPRRASSQTTSSPTTSRGRSARRTRA